MRHCTTLAIVLSLSACGRTTVPRDPNARRALPTRASPTRASPTRAPVIEPSTTPESSNTPPVPFATPVESISPSKTTTNETVPAAVAPKSPPLLHAGSRCNPQSRAYVRWECEDDRPRVRPKPTTIEEAREQAQLDKLTAEGITVREKLEREGKLAAYVKAQADEKAAREKKAAALAKKHAAIKAAIEKAAADKLAAEKATLQKPASSYGTATKPPKAAR